MREPKPFWKDVPVALRRQIESLLGSPIRTTSRVFGGYGPSATFRIFLQDGRSVFAKGAGPGSNEENWRVVPLEEAVYRDLQAIRSISPRYLGSVMDQGWHLLLLEDLRGSRKVPPWREELALQAVRGIAEFHVRGIQEAEKVQTMRFEGLVDSWRLMKTDLGEQECFLRLFANRRSLAEAWLHGALDRLAEAAADMMRPDQPWGLIHTDIRSDNLRFRGDRLILFDWPLAAHGPLIGDVTFFAPSVTGEGGPVAQRLLDEYKRIMARAGVTFPEFAEGAAAAATAGYFACRAGKPSVPELPRLRQVQRLQLGPALQWASLSLGLPRPPDLD